MRVEGEISNLRQASSGHVYFTLKDDQSQLPVVLFRGKARLLKFSPKDGLEVQVRGGISVYEDRGQLQLVAESMEPRGKGSLQVAFEQLYALLKEEGLFESERKRPLPMYPRTIGVITSSKGAVIHDILNVLARRHSRAHVLLYPVAVQEKRRPSEACRRSRLVPENPLRGCACCGARRWLAGRFWPPSIAEGSGRAQSLRRQFQWCPRSAMRTDFTIA